MLRLFAAALLAVSVVALSGCPRSQALDSTITYKPEKPDAQKVLIHQPRLDPNGKIVKAPELPERTPLPSTCVTLAECLEQAGDRAADNPPLRRSNYEQALHEYGRALKTDPRHLAAIVGTARIREKQGNYAEAVKQYEAAIAIAPQSAEVWFAAGMCHNRRDQMDRAIPCLRKAADLAPDHAEYQHHLIVSLAKAGMFEDSLALIRRKLPEDRANLNVAKMANHFGRRDLCGRYLHAALEANPNLTEAQQMLAVLEASVGVP